MGCAQKTRGALSTPAGSMTGLCASAGMVVAKRQRKLQHCQRASTPSPLFTALSPLLPPLMLLLVLHSLDGLDAKPDTRLEVAQHGAGGADKHTGPNVPHIFLGSDVANAARMYNMMPRRALQQTGGPPVGIIVGVAFCVTVLVVILVAVVFLKCMPRKSSPKVIAEEDAKKDPQEEEQDVEVWSIEQIQEVTKNFDAETVLEDAGHSTVYKGVGADGEKFAVKRAKKVSVEGGQLFQNEVDFLARLRHENLPKLRAFCDESGEQIVVFNYAEHGALSDWLRPDDSNHPVLTFAQRLRIARDMARAIHYLHTLKDSVIHRDVKSETVLLCEDFKAQVGGLGMLKHLPGEAMRIRMARKKGYLDPEYFQLFKVTSKCDVYSLGVVLLELITARTPVVSEEDVKVGSRITKRVVTLAQWAVPKVEDGELDSIVDPRLKEGEGYPQDLMYIFAGIAVSCVIPLRKNRPDIVRVTGWLEDLNEPDAATRPSLAQFAKKPASTDA